MNKIQPITTLRDTAEIEKELKGSKDPIILTKNGYPDLVVLSPEQYDSLLDEGGASLLSKTKNPLPVVLPFFSSEQDNPLGFVKVRAATFPIAVAGVEKNKQSLIAKVEEAERDGVKVLALPELCLSGYTCGDLFLAKTLQKKVESAIPEIASWSKDHDIFFVFGAPLSQGNCLFNCAVAVCHGEILGVVPKSYLPTYGEFYEKRHFTPANDSNSLIEIAGHSYRFGKKLLFVDRRYLALKIGIEICEDVWVPDTPSTAAALAGATVLLNLSASNEVVGKKEYRENLVSSTSARLCAAYVYADAGDGESSTDLVFGSHNLVAENGKILAETPLFAMESATSEIDLERLLSERKRMNTFGNAKENDFEIVPFDLGLDVPEKLLRHYSRNPFIPEGKNIDLERVSLIIKMQAKGLAQRLSAIHCSKVLIGISGGLDSTLALLVAVEAFKKLSLDLKGIYAITMPAFGTSERTHKNAADLSKDLGVSFEEVNIKDSLLAHFKDIHHSPEDRNLTYENAQARERTQVLMDLCSDRSAIMVGTGDLSELCLGWTTYNGDHMSMYGVNASIPKTLVRYLCQGYALLHPEAAAPLNDIIDTPISPELLPTDKAGQIAQKTEDKIGPYELHDFFLYYVLRFGFSPSKIFYLATQAYVGVYDKATIKKWLREFYLRFFHNQFKRSCLPDGAKVGTVAISPRGDWRMPSDASAEDYLKEIDGLEV
jgi:NAD+ synthase (glutamine-hydrolysing)